MPSEGAFIMLIFYTVNPEPASRPRAYIVRFFREKNDESHCFKMVSFPVRNPTKPRKTEEEAEEFGRIFVKNLMDKGLRDDYF